LHLLFSYNYSFIYIIFLYKVRNNLINNINKKLIIKNGSKNLKTFKSKIEFINVNYSYENKNLVSITVNKKKNTDGQVHEVDGITGATVTSDGITKFLRRDLERYKNFLIRSR